MSDAYTGFVRAFGRKTGDQMVEALIARFQPCEPLDREEQLGFTQCVKAGVSFAFKDDAFLQGGAIPATGPMTPIAVHLYSQGFEGFDQYRGPLPGGIQFSDSKAEVLRNLDAPAKSGGGNRSGSKVWPFWDRFDFQDHSLRVQYRAGNACVEIVTLMDLSER